MVGANEAGTEKIRQYTAGEISYRQFREWTAATLAAGPAATDSESYHVALFVEKLTNDQTAVLVDALEKGLTLGETVGSQA